MSHSAVRRRPAAAAAAIALAALVSSGVRAGPADLHPTVYVDEGACPGEGCSYGAWRVERDTVLLDKPRRGAKVVAHLRRGEAVTALTGQVTTVPARFVVKRDRGDFLRGDAFWVYTYLGEGYFKIWHDGRMQEDDLGFSPFPGGTAGDRCQDSVESCWGALDRPLQMTWWFKIRDDHGIEGWSKDDESFCQPKWCD